ncbi:MAG: acetate--CoA ligase family protein, partial [Sulfuricaulis sp.]|nr:acetate--CoA ligase family protein [Sulfuricaulis sp.]
LAFAAGRFPRGGRVAMVCFSGGTKGLFLDHANDEKLEIATFTSVTAERLAPLIDSGLALVNPLDAGAGIAYQQKKFSEVCRIVAADSNVDLVAMQGQLPMVPGDPSDSSVFSEVSRSTGKPVVAFGRMAQNSTEEGRRIQREAGMPFLQGLPATARALCGLVRYGKALQRGVTPIAAAGGKQEDLAVPAFGRLLARHGLAAPRSALARTLDEVPGLAIDIGFPVAVKIVSPQASHKTEVGGVTLSLGDAAAVRAAAGTMAQSLKSRNPDAVIEGYLVQEMVAGLEMIVGVRADPQFGPFMVVGLGGLFVEALNDIAIRLLPVDEERAHDMIQTLRGKTVLGSFRRKPARDVHAVAKAVAGLSSLYLDHRQWLRELEVNPLMVMAEGEGVRAVDVRVVLQH